jgi:hypothetical protein
MLRSDHIVESLAEAVQDSRPAVLIGYSVDPIRPRKLSNTAARDRTSDATARGLSVAKILLEHRIRDLGDVGVTLLRALPNVPSHTV